jgi:hypothetical protein
MLDIATGYNKYKFLGNDFLTWVWYLVENNINIKELIKSDYKKITLVIGNSIVLENSPGGKSKEKISIRGDEAGLEEGKTALKKGGVVTSINLILNIDTEEYKFSIKGESINISGFKTPSFKLEKNEELEGAILEKAFFCEKIYNFIDNLFISFIEKKSSDSFIDKDFHEIKKWILS